MLFFQKIQLTFDANGLLFSYTDLTTGQTIQLAQEILYYKGMSAESDGGPSGAYIFRPNGTDPFKIYENNVKLEVVEVSWKSLRWQLSIKDIIVTFILIL